MIVSADYALEQVNAGDATIEGVTNFDSLGVRHVVINNHGESRVDHVECCTTPGDESCVEKIAESFSEKVCEASGDVSDETAEEWFGEEILVSGLASEDVCEELSALNAWKILNVLNESGSAYVVEDAHGFRVAIHNR